MRWMPELKAKCDERQNADLVHLQPLLSQVLVSLTPVSTAERVPPIRLLTHSPDETLFDIAMRSHEIGKSASKECNDQSTWGKDSPH